MKIKNKVVTKFQLEVDYTELALIMLALRTYKSIYNKDEEQAHELASDLSIPVNKYN